MSHINYCKLFILLTGAQRLLFVSPFHLFSTPFRSTTVRSRSNIVFFSAARLHRTAWTRKSTKMSSESGVGLNDIAAAASSTPYMANYCVPLTPWREAMDVSIAKSRKIRGGNFVQISTIDLETNQPRCRTVVFRGFQKMGTTEQENESCVMKMITDSRSNKVKELTTSPVMEMVWWFGKSSEQYRIRGKVQLIREGELDDFLSRARREQWGNLSDSARDQFYWEEPGIEYAEENRQNEIPTGGRDVKGKVLPPPNEFLLMLLHPFLVDYLRLTDNYRQIDELDITSKSWKTKRVTP